MDTIIKLTQLEYYPEENCNYILWQTIENTLIIKQKFIVYYALSNRHLTLRTISTLKSNQKFC